MNGPAWIWIAPKPIHPLVAEPVGEVPRQQAAPPLKPLQDVRRDILPMGHMQDPNRRDTVHDLPTDERVALAEDRGGATAVVV
jgi:hypothetical protein